MFQVESDKFDDMNRRFDEFAFQLKEIYSLLDGFTSRYNDVMNRIDRIDDVIYDSAENNFTIPCNLNNNNYSLLRCITIVVVFYSDVQRFPVFHNGHDLRMSNWTIHLRC